MQAMFSFGQEEKKSLQARKTVGQLNPLFLCLAVCWLAGSRIRLFEIDLLAQSFNARPVSAHVANPEARG